MDNRAAVAVLARVAPAKWRHSTTSNPVVCGENDAAGRALPAHGKIATLGAVTVAHAGDRADEKGGAMLLRTLSLIAVLASIATASQAGDIHRVVTTLADSQVTLNVSPSGNASANLWLTTSSPPGFSFNEDVA